MRLRRGFALLVLAGLTLAACSSGSSAGTGGGAEALSLDEATVPEELRHLVPMAEQWGIGDDVDRYDKVEASSPEEREALRSAVAPHDRRITAWLDSFGEGLMTDEAAAFMYMLIAIEEMQPVTSS